MPRLFLFSSKGFIRVGRFHDALFSIGVVERQPNLDETWNRRVLRGQIKDYKWQAAHFPKQFHVRRANVEVWGRRGLTPELREQLVQTLRGLPDHGDATVIG